MVGAIPEIRWIHNGFIGPARKSSSLGTYAADFYGGLAGRGVAIPRFQPSPDPCHASEPMPLRSFPLYQDNSRRDAGSSALIVTD